MTRSQVDASSMMKIERSRDHTIATPKKSAPATESLSMYTTLLHSHWVEPLHSGLLKTFLALIRMLTFSGLSPGPGLMRSPPAKKRDIVVDLHHGCRRMMLIRRK